MICVGAAAMERLMPMFLWLDASGHVRDAGPTLTKLLPEAALVGRDFFTLFQVKRPRGVLSMDDLLRQAGARLHLHLCERPQTGFRGIAVPLLAGAGALVNLSFGISVAEAVRDHRLTDADFAPTDLTVEMLYLAEAKTVVMDELHDLNRRLQHAKSAAEAQALSDTLTGLANRRALDRVLNGLTRSGVAFGLMHLDLDFFKQVNDTLGHAAGDHVLRQVAVILRDETRAGDTAARVGGDEFVLIFPGLAQVDRLRAIAERIIARLSVPIAYKGRECRISASVGMTISAHYRVPDAERMLADADGALYLSKERGRAQVTEWVPQGDVPSAD